MPSTLEGCRDLIASLHARLEESEETLAAIGRGDIDAVVVTRGDADHRVYTLENADRPYRVLIEQIQEGAVTIGIDGTVFYCNRRLAAMLGTPQDRVIGQTLHPFVASADLGAFNRLLEDACHGDARDEIMLITLSGARVPVVMSLSLLQAEGSHTLLCGVLTDQTQQKSHLRELSEANARLVTASQQREAVEEALRQSQKMEAVGQLTGGLAHDFNNLLAVILGSLELMQNDLRHSRLANLDHYLSSAMTSANRGAALTHRLLAFSRRQSLEPKLVMPNRLVAGMQDLLQRTVGASMTVVTELPADTGAILCDPNQIENALLNLAINGRDAMPNGGQLTIATANVDFDDARAAEIDVAKGSYVVISVTDTGVGMPAHVVKRAFDPFFTTKPVGQGTGLGLSMIYGFARQSGGQAIIRSVVGQGSTIDIYFPRQGPGTSPPLIEERRALVENESGGGVSRRVPPRAKTATVMVVDDEPGIRMLMVRVMERLGYAVIEAAESEAALRHFDAGTRIDVLVTDVALPHGLNGRQLAAEARSRRPGLPVLFITGYEDSEIAEFVHSEPEPELMTKPFSMHALADRVRAMICQARPTAPEAGGS